MSREVGLVILGASKFAHFPRLDNPAFARSADAIREAFATALLASTPPTVLDLFDSSEAPRDIVSHIRKFLAAHKHFTDVVIFYCGHGCFLSDKIFYLAINQSTETDPYSGLIVSFIRTALENDLAGKNVFLILDCCFAGQAVSEWGKGIGKGNALALASSADGRALAPRTEPLTRFSSGFVQAILDGIPNGSRTLSFRDVVKEIAETMVSKYGAQAARAEIHTPRQTSEDIADIPFFSNLWFSGNIEAKKQLRHDIRSSNASDIHDKLDAVSNCVVILSDSERTAEFKLQRAVEAALQLLDNQLPIDLSHLTMKYATDIVATRTSFDRSIVEMCRAPVVIIDGTDFEPAAMLLLGVRSVVRRGVTIISIGGDYYIGGEIDVPFTIKDANLVAHSRNQQEKGRRDASELLADRIRTGLQSANSPWYSDLAVFDAIRQLTPDRRGIIVDREGFLVLCSFEKKYVDDIWWPYIRKGLDHQLRKLRQKESSLPLLGVARSFELDSPRLVSQAIYEAIRRAQTCIVDWTNWSENVFFEFGVRLTIASTRHRTIPIIKGDKQPKTDQHKNLISLFDPISYVGSGDWRADPAFGRMIDLSPVRPHSDSTIGPTSAHVYGIVRDALDLSVQPATIPLEEWLLQESQLYRRVSTNSKPVSLFPEHAELSRNEMIAERERLLAVWSYLVSRYGEGKIFASEALRGSCIAAVDALLGRHYSELEQEPELLSKLAALQDKLSKRDRE
jgi:hypothetical protein